MKGTTQKRLEKGKEENGAVTSCALVTVKGEKVVPSSFSPELSQLMEPHDQGYRAERV